MSDLQRLQQEHADWQLQNFGVVPAWQMILGATEELGEVCHAYLKMANGIRGDRAQHTAKIKDGIGDTVIFLIGLCTVMGFDFESILDETWQEVKQRDWKANPNGDGYGDRHIEASR